jgi:HK97 family phage prohead protease
MKIERRLIPTKFEIRSGESEEIRQITGYGAVYNDLSEDLGGFREKIEPGAFDGVVSDDVRALVNHDSNLILGRTGAGTLRLSVDDVGLRYEVDLPDTSYARDLAVSMQRGDITQSSFGFYIEDDDWAKRDDGTIVRTIKKVRQLLDVSPVTYPAYPTTSSEARSLICVDASGLEDLEKQTEIESDRRSRKLDIIEKIRGSAW